LYGGKVIEKADATAEIKKTNALDPSLDKNAVAVETVKVNAA